MSADSIFAGVSRFHFFPSPLSSPPILLKGIAISSISALILDHIVQDHTCGRKFNDEDLDSQQTLSRLENTITQNDLYRLGEYFVTLYIRRNRKRKPKRIILDLDGTDDPTYGDQQMTFFHGYYDQYMYHPLVIYDADTGCNVSHYSDPKISQSQGVTCAIRQRINNS